MDVQSTVDRTINSHMKSSKNVVSKAMRGTGKVLAESGRSDKKKTSDAKAKAYAQGIMDVLYSQQLAGMALPGQQPGEESAFPFTRGLSEAAEGPPGLGGPPMPTAPPPMPEGPMGPPPMPPGPPVPAGMAPSGPVLPPGLAPSPPVAAGPLGALSPNALLRSQMPRV